MRQKATIAGLTGMLMLLTIFFTLFGSINITYAQTARNPVLEFCTGTW
ncbi:MAG: hypothetical protein WAN36_11880 [Calditrichia bacterium]